MPSATLWTIHAGAGFTSFTDDPWPHLDNVIAIAEFEWIDTDQGWSGNRMPAPYMSDEGFNVGDWAADIIQGTGGMDDYERYEVVAWNDPDRVAAAKWVLRCLANPKCDGSDRMLAAITERRKNLHPTA